MRRRAPEPGALDWHAALDRAVALAPGRCPEEDVAALRALKGHVEQRLGLGDAVTVAALAGGTGVGKSALVNRLAGTEVVDEGVRRPTTAVPVAVAATIDAPTARLLDWLAIDDRRQVPGALPDGLVLVDLPDHDSVAAAHRRTSDRLAARADVVVIVVDAVKYARADLHEGPLAALTAHAEVLVVVLNRSDELAEPDVALVRADLERRLAEDGLAEVAVLTTSATDGVGIAELRDLLGGLAAARTAATRRLVADGALLAADLHPGVPELPALTGHLEPLVTAALDATDAHRTLGLALVQQRRLAQQAVRSPLAKAVRSPATLVRWAGRGLGFGAAQRAAGPDPGRARGQDRLADRLADALGLAVTTGPAHTLLDRAIAQAAATAAPAVVHAVRDHADGTARTRRRWWPLLAGARGAAETVTLVGLAWLLVLEAVVWLGLPPLPVPQLTDVLTWPAGLLLGGLAARVLLGGVTRLVLWSSSRRLRRRARREQRAAVAGVIERELLVPYEREAAAVAELRAALGVLARS